MKPTLALSALLFLLAACGKGDDTPTDTEFATGDGQTLADAMTERPRVPWAIATANDDATRAGADILSRGGTAVDAAVAVQAVLGLVEPQSSGLGGGAFMLFYDATSGVITAYDGREVAPLTADPSMFLGDDGEPMNFYDAVTSGRAVGVPGVVAMLDLAHTEHGELEWAELFTTAERLATEGFTVGERLPSLLSRFSRLKENEAARAYFYTEDGTPIAPGSTLRNPVYAETVREVAAGGAGAFYSGQVAQQIVDAVNDRTGVVTMTLDDLAEYEPIKRQPVCAPFRTQLVCSMPPPSSGGVTVLQILALSELAGIGEAPSPEGWATYAEASRLAYADRNLYLGDPSAMGAGTLEADDLVSGLIDTRYLEGRAALIGEAAAENVTPGDPTLVPVRERLSPDSSPELPGTSHFSIRDVYGNVVSMTTTVEFAFGSHLMAGGMILNNQLTDFSFRPEVDGVPVVNAAEPGKRPRSSMAPVIVLGEDGTPSMAVGSPGGPAIIGYVAKTLLLTLGWDTDLQAAIEHPNVVVPRGSVIVEPGADTMITDGLSAYGYDVTERSLTSGLYGFALTDEGIVAGVDPRREGSFMAEE